MKLWKEISETVTANEEDDSELIAVIAAAIAASRTRHQLIAL